SDEPLVQTPTTNISIRSRMYADYMLDPDTNSVRAHSQRYHTSLKRIEAILRLKGMGAAYVKEPILPVAKRHAQAAEDHKSNPRFKDSRTMKSPRAKVQTVERVGRPPVHFVDVGGKFIVVQERLWWLTLAERRTALTARKSE
ncbi:hypothetical protein B0H17DRAFT_1104903, partial [Mycena rosella]